ncbi:hypothetical protein [Tenacibaculum aiptasiae]|uniref:hypothetical protein n=1 Tax=Tenacibaculum aiptasiae TaxID=426481 RepID=UPI00232FA7FB|nr:hypothetical protein [Tenacibaculum aiptasiae]
MQSKIHHSTFHKFSFLNRIKILIGKELRVDSEIEISEEVVIGESKARAFIAPLFPRRIETKKSINL